MELINKVADKLRKGIRTFLRITPPTENVIVLTGGMDFCLNCTKNRIWYNGKSAQLSQFYSQLDGIVQNTMFWAAPMTRGLEIRKLHTGIPKLVIDVLSEIVANDFNGVNVNGGKGGQIYESWQTISRKNEIEEKLLKKIVKEACVVGDGAIKLSYDSAVSGNPIIEWFPAERVKFTYRRGIIREVKFFTEYIHKSKKYQFAEIYGYGYVTYKLLDSSDNEVALDTIPETAWAKGESIVFDDSVIFAVPVILGESSRFEGRGESLIESKEDAGDALDESFSQWMDALRSGRSKEYFPENLVPRDPNTGKLREPNPFDNRFVVVGASMSENSSNKILIETPNIQHESYLATYITALDLYLQGLISPSTLGIDVKKLDNADAQREKEKTTLYTRQKLVSLVNKFVPELVRAAVNFDRIVIHGESAVAEDFEITTNFGEYANPSFESQVETVSKARAGGVMSIRTAIDEVYGDSKDDKWKEEEERKIKEENGIATLDEASEHDDIDLSDDE